MWLRRMMVEAGPMDVEEERFQNRWLPPRINEAIVAQAAHSKSPTSYLCRNSGHSSSFTDTLECIRRVAYFGLLVQDRTNTPTYGRLLSRGNSAPRRPWQCMLA